MATDHKSGKLKTVDGICPGNRLRLLAGVFADRDQTQELYPPASQADLLTDFSTLQRQGKRRSWHVQPNKVLTPKKFNDVYLYDMPPNRNSPIQSKCERDLSDCNNAYDIPPPAVPLTYDTPRNCFQSSPIPPAVSPVQIDSAESYDVPRPLVFGQQQLTPSSSASSLTADSLSSSNRSSIINMPDYDIPKSRGLQLHLQPSQLYDTPLPNAQVKELPLELSSAMETLARLQTEATAAISRLLGYVTPQWRQKDKLEVKLMDIKLAVVRLKTSLHDLTEFGEGALGNATKAPDRGLALKLRPLVLALRNADRLIEDAARILDSQKWELGVLTRNENDDIFTSPDSLEQVVACARALTEDVRQTTSFIQGNSTLLFKRGPSLQGSGSQSDWFEDYDYVKLESRESVERKHAEIRDALPNELKKGYDALVKAAESVAVNDSKSLDNTVDHNDKQVLSFYAAQVTTHHTYLTNAIDAFLQTVEHNQPPKVFLAHGKFVVLSAHKLVHIGDTVHRNVTKPDVKERVLHCSNALCDALAVCVNKTKLAALQFPSVTAVQEMVDSVVDISHLARDLKLLLIQAAQL